MIKVLKGTVACCSEHNVTIMLENCGIGFDVVVAQPTLFEVGKAAELFIYMHFNQENGPTLYGFKTMQEREFFMLVIGCSGIGPKIALTILEQTAIADFVHSVKTSDVAWLSKLKGIGAKKAEQLAIQLKDKIDTFVCAQAVQTNGLSVHIKQLTDVLQSLNYSRAEIQQALMYVRENITDEAIAFEFCLRKALLFLSQRI